MADQTEPPSTGLMKLLAFDAEDLAVVSAAFQDAIVRVADMAFLPREQRFALAAARFDWVAALQDRRERCWTGLHFERVSDVKHIGVPQDTPAAMLNLLAIGFTPGDPPSGEISLTFSGGASIKLTVECIEAQMRDTGPRWQTKSLPGHPIEDIPPEAVAPERKEGSKPAADGGPA
ncbi:MAG: DUF2948 family protein [Methylobacteriaceae bacterium]|nr:DUF2948 family protein [Methylobacteriaceae bacterium]